MSYCSQCGKELVPGAKFCQNCGAPVESAAAAGASEGSSAGHYQQQNAQPNYNYVQQDIPSTGLNVLAFFLPLVGLILYLVYVDSTPRRAKDIGKFALIGFGVGVALGVIGAIIQGVVLASLPVRTALYAALAAAFLPNLMRRFRARRACAGTHAVVMICAAGREYRLDALTGTGNALVEPLSGKPVVVAYLPELAEHAHIPIPTATAGGTGILYALRPEQISINGRESEALLALSSVPLHGTEALLPPELAERTELGG